VALRAALFDIGGTLITSSVPDPWRAPVMARLEAAFGRQRWLDDVYDADIRRPPANDPHRQETTRWLATWLDEHGVELGPEHVERLRAAFAAPLPAEFALTPGAGEALRWCKAHGLTVVTVSNALSSADADVRRNCESLGIGDAVDHVVSSYSFGWEKPHPGIFERALWLARTTPVNACMVGDDFEADIVGAKAVGMRAVWRSSHERPRGATVFPDATIASLEELPPILERWL